MVEKQPCCREFFSTVYCGSRSKTYLHARLDNVMQSKFERVDKRGGSVSHKSEDVI